MKKHMLNYWYMPSSGQSFPEELKSLFSVLWIGEISGNTLVDESGNGNDINITNKDFATNYIPPTSTATFSLDDVAALKTDDNFDGCWFTEAGSVKQVPVTYFINNDYSRTLVKYSNESPYNVEWIGLLDDAATPTTEEWEQLHSLFKLHIFWSGVFNDYGILKDNRALEGQGYKGWISQVQSLSLTEPSTTVKSSVNKLALDLRNYGVDTGFDRFWVFMLNDDTIVSGAGSVSLFNHGSTRMSFPVAPTYTTSGMKGNGSSQYALDNFNPTTDAVNWTLNSASVGMYLYATKTIATSYMHGCISSAIDCLTASNSALQRINGTSFGPTVDLNVAEYVAINRSASNAGQIYRGTTQSTGTGASSALSNQSFVTMRSQFGYGDNGISMKFLGRSFSQTEHANIRTAFLAHKTRLGL